jgi:hypothetical protein
MEKSKIEGRYFYADSDQSQPFPATQLGGPAAAGFPQLVNNELRNFTLGHKYTFGPTLINQADFGFHRVFVPTVQVEPFQYSDIGVTAPSNANPFPAISIQGSLTLGGNGQGFESAQNNFTFQDSITWVRGRHNLRFGGGITRSQINATDFHFLGGMVFLSWPDFLLGLPGTPVSAGGNGTGISNVFLSVDVPGLFDRYWRIWDGNAYIQDDIKLTSSFTLNFGVRYERLGQLSDKLGRNSGFDIELANPNPPAGGTLEGFVVSKDIQVPVPAGVKQLDNNFGIRGEHQNTIGPRFRFAWRLPNTILPFTERMALRGGYGIYYTRATGQPFFQLVANPPFAVARQLQGAPNAAASFASPFGPEQPLPQFTPYSPTTQRFVTFIGQDYRPPVTQQLSLNLQTDLGRDLLLEVGYLGTKGTHQIINRSLNQALLASPSNPIRGVTTNTVANVPQRVPYQGFTASGIADINSVAFNRYDGLHVSLAKRMSNGLQFLAAYTFSHAYSDGASNTFAGGGAITGDQTDLRDNYGRVDFNREHRLVVSYYYQLPSPQRLNAFFKYALGGWAVSGVTVLQSGARLTLTGTNANNVYGITTNRAQLAAGCTYDDLLTSGSVRSKLSNFFNRSCIARNPAGAAIWPVVGDDGRATAFGNSGAGILAGPDQRNFDISVVKRTPLGGLREGANIEFRAEFFNAFNTTQFGNPNTNVSQANFGLISGTAVNPRIVQLALKLNF